MSFLLHLQGEVAISFHEIECLPEGQLAPAEAQSRIRDPLGLWQELCC